jgi:hypothetical protein
MTVSEKVNELALKKYKVLTVDELKNTIVNIEYQKITDKYIDEVKLRIVRQKQDEAKNYEPTDEEIIERLQAKLDAAK